MNLSPSLSSSSLSSYLKMWIDLMLNILILSSEWREILNSIQLWKRRKKRKKKRRKRHGKKEPDDAAVFAAKFLWWPLYSGLFFTPRTLNPISWNQLFCHRPMVGNSCWSSMPSLTKTSFSRNWPERVKGAKGETIFQIHYVNEMTWWNIAWCRFHVSMI